MASMVLGVAPGCLFFLAGWFGFCWRCQARLVGQSAGASALGAASSGQGLVWVLVAASGGAPGWATCVGRRRVWVRADGAPCRAASGPGRSSRRFGVLLPGGRVLVVRLDSAVAVAGCGGWQRLVAGGGSLLVSAVLGTGVCSRIWLLALSWGIWSAAAFGSGGCGLWWAAALTGCGPPVHRGAWRCFVLLLASGFVNGSTAGLRGGRCGTWWTVLLVGCGAWVARCSRRGRAPLAALGWVHGSSVVLGGCGCGLRWLVLPCGRRWFIVVSDGIGRVEFVA